MREKETVGTFDKRPREEGERRQGIKAGVKREGVIGRKKVGSDPAAALGHFSFKLVGCT